MGKEARAWAKEHLKGNKWNVWKGVLVVSVISSVASFIAQLFAGPDPNNPSMTSQLLESAFSIAMLPMTIGLIVYIGNLVRGKKFEINQIFSKYSSFVRIFVTSLLEGIIVFLFTLLLIVPGIIRAIAYFLVNYMLADPDFDDKGYKELLDLSKEIMNGHKAEYFGMMMYYFLMMILGCFTLGILWIWTIPEMQLACVKYANELLDEYKKGNKKSSKKEK